MYGWPPYFSDLRQLFETVAFAFSIMAVNGGVSSTLSFGLPSGAETFSFGPSSCALSTSQYCSTRWSRRYGMGVVHSLPLHHVRRGINGGVGVFNAVRWALY